MRNHGRFSEEVDNSLLLVFLLRRTGCEIGSAPRSQENDLSFPKSASKYPTVSETLGARGCNSQSKWRILYVSIKRRGTLIRGGKVKCNKKRRGLEHRFLPPCSTVGQLITLMSKVRLKTTLTQKSVHLEFSDAGFVSLRAFFPAKYISFPPAW